MNRFHIHVHVTDLESCVSFYSQLFGAEPAILGATDCSFFTGPNVMEQRSNLKPRQAHLSKTCRFTPSISLHWK